MRKKNCKINMKKKKNKQKKTILVYLTFTTGNAA